MAVPLSDVVFNPFEYAHTKPKGAVEITDEVIAYFSANLQKCMRSEYVEHDTTVVTLSPSPEGAIIFVVKDGRPNFAEHIEKVIKTCGKIFENGGAFGMPKNIARIFRSDQEGFQVTVTLSAKRLISQLL